MQTETILDGILAMLTGRDPVRLEQPPATAFGQHAALDGAAVNPPAGR